MNNKWNYSVAKNTKETSENEKLRPNWTNNKFVFSPNGGQRTIKYSLFHNYFFSVIVKTITKRKTPPKDPIK